MKQFIVLLSFCLFSIGVNAETQTDLDCLAKVIYHEARGEPEEGQVAVAWVVMNRLNSQRFSNTICGVVYQKSQFSWTAFKYKIRDRNAYELAENLARLVLYEAIPDPTNGAIYFDSLGRKPGRKTKQLVKIKHHYFYS